MANEKSNKLQEPQQTLTNNQITTERTLGRRSFLTAVGAVVAGGAAALALGDRLDAAVTGPQQRSDPDQKKERSDPDQKKKKQRSDPDQKKKMKGHSTSPDQNKKGVHGDPDKKKKGTAGDPDHSKARI